MNDQKLNPVTVAICAILLAAVFLPAFVFDELFPDLRSQQLQYDDWQMWQFWYECLINNHLGYPIWSAFDAISDKLKLAFWMLTTIGTPFGGIAGALIWKQRQNKAIEVGQTSAVFAGKEDIKEYLGKDGEGLILSKSVRMRQNTCFTHLLVVGPTGSGKTQSFFLPNIMKLDPEYSLVITDPKGELYQKTAAHQRSVGREPILLKLDKKDVSISWNPLDVPTDSVTMAKVCTSIVKNKGGGGAGGGGDQDMWDQSAIDLLMALVYIVKALPAYGEQASERPYGNLTNVLKLLSLPFESLFGLAKYSIAVLGVTDIYDRIAGFLEAPDDTRNSTKFVLKTALSSFMIDDVACITAVTNFDFRDLKRKPLALYVSVPEHKVTALAPVISTLYMQIFDSLLDMGEGGRPVFFLMDEFANIGKVIGFPQYVATIRSRNLSVSVCLQSFEQLTRNYSEPEKQEILNNLKVTVVLPGLKEEKTLQYLQTVGGKVAELVKSSAKEDERAITKDRLPINEIREMQDNYDTGVHEALVLFPNKPAFKDRQRRSYSDPEVKALLDNCGKTEFPVRNAEEVRIVSQDSFLSIGNLELLDAIGAYLSYHGSIENYAKDDKMSVLAKFDKVNTLMNGLPLFEVVQRNGEPDPELEINWIKDPETHEGWMVRSMVITSFQWAYNQGIFKPPKKKSKEH